MLRPNIAASTSHSLPDEVTRAPVRLSPACGDASAPIQVAGRLTVPRPSGVSYPPSWGRAAGGLGQALLGGRTRSVARQQAARPPPPCAQALAPVDPSALWIPARAFLPRGASCKAVLDQMPKLKLSGCELAGPKELPGLESPRWAVFWPIKPTAYLALMFFIHLNE